ncbi:MAG: DJ-1/PfpI family protein [Christensenella sp.]|nr:DJ-1/PfpI family protein [Christensenella sp.]
MEQKTVGIFLFNEVEVLDFAGPFEVFSLAESETSGKRAFRVCTIARTNAPNRARNGLTVLPAYDFSSAPKLDLLIVPGGYGAEELEIREPETIRWLQSIADQAEIVASICTGAFLLAEAGLLNGKRATTHWMDLDRLEREYPAVQVLRNTRFVDEGAILTSGGISAGIDLSLYLVKRLLGAPAAKKTARRMEYDCSIL